MGKRRGDKRDLSRLELDVMGIVWELGECSSAEVIAAFQQKRKLAPTTIRTVLANLRRKGFVTPIPTIERGFRLRPVVPKEDVARSTFTSLIDSLFGGSPGQAIVYLLGDEELDDDELAAIRQTLDDKRAQRTKNGGRS